MSAKLNNPIKVFETEGPELGRDPLQALIVELTHRST